MKESSRVGSKKIVKRINLLFLIMSRLIPSMVH